MAGTVYAPALSQGTVISRSLLLPTAEPRDFAGRATLDAADQSDPDFSLALALQISTTPGGEWQTVAYLEWQGGGPVPSVNWSGPARRVRLTIDLSRPASVGMTISH